MFTPRKGLEIDLREIQTLWINLDRDTERKARMESMFTTLEMDNHRRIPGYPATTVKEGCGKAQENTLSQIENYPTLVLEDDCLQTGHFVPVINVPEDADAVYLGCSHWGMDWETGRNGPFAKWTEHGEDWLRVTNMLATHSILYLNQDFKEACEDIIKKYVYEIEDHIDIGYCSILKDWNIYTPTHPFFYQSSSAQVTMTSLKDKPIRRPSHQTNTMIQNHTPSPTRPRDYRVTETRQPNHIAVKRRDRAAFAVRNAKVTPGTGRVRRKGR